MRYLQTRLIRSSVLFLFLVIKQGVACFATILFHTSVKLRHMYMCGKAPYLLFDIILVLPWELFPLKFQSAQKKDTSGKFAKKLDRKGVILQHPTENVCALQN